MKAMLAASCLLAIATTSQARPASKPPAPAPAPSAADDDECPVEFRGATVEALKMPGGVRLEFRNRNRARLADMRAQLRAIADMIEQHGTEQQTAGEDDEVDFPPVDIDVKDIVLGARVTVRATRLRDIPALRELAFGFAEFWQGSPCNPPLIGAR